MATRTLVVQDFDETADGLSLNVSRTQGGFTVAISHSDRTTGIVSSCTIDTASELSGAERTALRNVVLGFLAKAKPKMSFV